MTINRLNQGVTNQVLVKAVSGQTTNLLELQDSTGAVVSSIGPTGALGGTIGNSGLVHINTTTMSAVAAQAVTFASSTHKNYKLFMTWTQSASAAMTIRVRSSTSDFSGAQYNSAVFLNRSAGTTSGVDTAAQNQTSGRISNDGFDSTTTSINQLEMLISNLFEATSTSFNTKLTVADSVANVANLSGAIRVRETTSRDGINFILGSGTMTGIIQIFGVKE